MLIKSFYEFLTSNKSFGTFWDFDEFHQKFNAYLSSYE